MNRNERHFHSSNQWERTHQLRPDRGGPGNKFCHEVQQPPEPKPLATIQKRQDPLWEMSAYKVGPPGVYQQYVENAGYLKLQRQYNFFLRVYILNRAFEQFQEVFSRVWNPLHSYWRPWNASLSGSWVTCRCITETDKPFISKNFENLPDTSTYGQ